MDNLFGSDLQHQFKNELNLIDKNLEHTLGVS